MKQYQTAVVTILSLNQSDILTASTGYSAPVIDDMNLPIIWY